MHSFQAIKEYRLQPLLIFKNPFNKQWIFITVKYSLRFSVLSMSFLKAKYFWFESSNPTYMQLKETGDKKFAVGPEIGHYSKEFRIWPYCYEP